MKYKYKIVDHVPNVDTNTHSLLQIGAELANTKKYSSKLEVVCFYTEEADRVAVVIKDLGIDWVTEEEDTYRSMAKKLGYTYME
jgi:hypothetical protein